MYANFQKSYYGKDSVPILKKVNYLTQSAPVDVRLEFEARDNFPALTSAYCLVLHDRIVQYNPLSGDVKKLV